MRVHTAAAVLVGLVLLAAPRAEAQATLDAARQLYASAEYENALTMLDGLKSGDRPFEEQRTIDLYRVLCLVATGKDADATGVMEGLIARNPLYRPSDELPPRVRTTFNETRKRLLPTAVQTTYQEAKAAYDFKDYVTAERGFASVLEVLNDPDVANVANKSPLSDLRTLATGFHELSKKAIVPAVAVAAAPAAAPVIPPPVPARRLRRSTGRRYQRRPPIALVQRIRHSRSDPFHADRCDRGAHRRHGSGRVGLDARVGQSAVRQDRRQRCQDLAVLSREGRWRAVKFLKRIQVSLVPGN